MNAALNILASLKSSLTIYKFQWSVAYFATQWIRKKYVESSKLHKIFTSNNETFFMKSRNDIFNNGGKRTKNENENRLKKLPENVTYSLKSLELKLFI